MIISMESNLANDERFADSLRKEVDWLEFSDSQSKFRQKNFCKPNDSILELTDPTPSIHDLFVRFDKNFFWGSLGMVQVLWSNRMTKCAGMCYFEGRNGLCKISLSAPLLSLRPRKDLVETLLHEMIHAYLFVTNNYRDRDDHGTEFHKHMYRINKEAGTSISVYHTFHDEVEYYQRHIWRCDGPCRFEKPYYGFVKRAMNRAPGPNDTWWSQHKMNCKGTFIKVSEPENKAKKIVKLNSKKTTEKSKLPDIRNFMRIAPDIKENPAKNFNVKESEKQVVNMHNSEMETINVNTIFHGQKNEINTDSAKLSTEVWNKGNKADLNRGAVSEFVRNIWSMRYGTLSSSSSQNALKELRSTNMNIEPPKGSTESDKKVLKKKFGINQTTTQMENGKIEQNRCIVCSRTLLSEMNDHLDNCLHNTVTNEVNYDEAETENDINCLSVPCPCCYQWILESQMNHHIDECLTIVALKNGAFD